MPRTVTLKNINSFFFLLFMLAFSMSCEHQTSTHSTTEKRFELKSPEETGVNFKNTITENDSLNYFTYGYLYMGGGVAVGDINNDGWVDIYLNGNMTPNKLYLNNGDFTFTDITNTANIAGDDRWYTGVAMADVNNDGFLDIYCSVGGKFTPKENQLFINNGDLTFSEKGETYGVADMGNSVQGTFFDYDKDGDLDLYVANYPPTPFGAPTHYYQSKMRLLRNSESDHLFRNDGGKFTDVTTESGVKSFGLSLSATVGDLNNDGWEDIYVSNDFATPDYLYMNNGDGTFTNTIKEATKNTAFYGMGVDINDSNNDGLLDILQMDMSAQDNYRAKANMASMNIALFWSTVNSGFHYQYMQNALQINNGNLRADSIPDFSNLSRFAGLSSTDWSWSPLFADLDNDGLKDIFVSNGTKREINNNDYFNEIGKKPLTEDELLEKSLAIPSEPIDNFVYKNLGNNTFEQQNEAWGISYKGFSNGSAYADLDNDGDLDLITNNIDDDVTIFENKTSDNGHVSVRLKGDTDNLFGLGSKVTIYHDGSKQFQQLTLTRGFQSSVAAKLHFGIGQATKVDSVLVEWPNGTISKKTDIHANTDLIIAQEDAAIAKKHKESSGHLFVDVSTNLSAEPIIHQENRYDDFKTEILLPHSTSKFGPGIATGDVNGDGDDDLIVAGASGFPTRLYVASKGTLVEKSVGDFISDSLHEDMDMTLFDADNDGDLDLYVISGGNEFLPDASELHDRLYSNDGEGNFTKLKTTLPTKAISGGRVIPHDYDKDGDLDLFVSGRLAPKAYPSPVSSQLLRNDSHRGGIQFTDVTDVLAPALIELGMATDAVWTDVNNDGWDDLIVVGEWMPITVLLNENGSGFADHTKNYGLHESNGWWFSIAKADLDHDGDDDYLVGNLGLNYKYKASEEAPFEIFYDDFDRNGKGDIVLGYYNKGTLYPVRGRECSSQQIPGIKRKFKDYESFANASLIDVYDEESLEASLYYKIKSFASIWLENKDGKLIAHELPKEAQWAPINKFLVNDFDGDQKADIVLAGNLHASEVETPRADAGIGLFLKGNNDGSFKPLSAKTSGLYLPGDVKDLELLTLGEKTYIVAGRNSDGVRFISSR